MSSVAKPDLAAGTSVGQYTIRRRIGAGGMGEVYEAVHTGLDKRVAIKTLRRHYGENEVIVQRFLREGQLASRLRHPHVVDMTDVGMIAGLPCLVMEFLEGESLHALFKREGALEVSRLVDILLPVVAAVDAAHRLGIIHRDLKPANIFLTRGLHGEAHPKVLDFGISKIMQDAPGELTTDSTFLGSPHYVSPELARGDKNLDGRSDQYSMGVILYEGLCGVRPFADKAETFMSLMYAIASGEFRPPRAVRPDIPPEFEAVVLRAMAKQKNDRFPSVGTLGRALLPFASPRAQVIWGPLLSDGSAPVSGPVDSGAMRVSVPSIPIPISKPNVPGEHTVFEGGRNSISLEESQGTIGRSASEIQTASRTKPLGTVWWTAAGGAAIAFGLAVALGITSWVASERSAEGTAESDDPVVVTTPQTYAVALSVEPKEAVIELDGRVAATGSFSRTFTADGQSHTLRLAAPGYETQTLVFGSTAPPPEQITLQPAVEKPEKPGRKSGHNAPAPKPTASSPPPSTATPLKTDNRDPWAQ